MHKHNILKLFILLIVVIFHINGFAQISSPDAHYVDTTKYNNNDLGEHLIFVYTTQRGNYDPEPELIAELPEYDSLTYRWMAYNPITFLHDDTVKIETNVTTSNYSTTIEGGFKVDVFNADVDTSFYCWVNISAFIISNIDIYNSTCETMELRTSLLFDEIFAYYDLVDSTLKEQKHEVISKEWEVTPEGIQVGAVLNPSFEAPVQYTRFSLTLTDNFEQTRSSYVDIEEEELERGEKFLIATRADFEASRIYVPEGETDSTGQAPLVVQFKNLSENGEGFQWRFFQEQSHIAAGADSVMEISDLETPLDSILYKPGKRIKGVSQEGKYKVELTSYGPVYEINGEQKQCVDVKTSEEDYIVVDSITIPAFANVFTPPGEPNAIFHFADGLTSSFEGAKSVKHFSIKIYNRWGNKVYEYEGDINKWPGWDGTTVGSLVAKTGVYYYSAHIEGWDNNAYDKQGYIHLFRDDK